MPKRLPEFFLIDMLISIDVISRYMTKIKDAIDFVENEAVFIIVTRELEILGEATNNFLKDKNLAQLTQPTWRQVVDFRNVISHEYFGLNFEEIYDIIINELPAFEQEIFEVVVKVKNSENFKLALLETQKDFRKIGRHESVCYLEGIEYRLYKT